MEENTFIITDKFDPIVKATAIKLLEHVIKTNSTIFYSDLTDSLKPDFDINPRNIEHFLVFISFACKANGIPPISVMVVSKDTLMPGSGFYKAYFPELKSDSEREKKCFELMKQVQEYDNWDSVLTAYKKWHS